MAIRPDFLECVHGPVTTHEETTELEGAIGEDPDPDEDVLSDRSRRKCYAQALPFEIEILKDEEVAPDLRTIHIIMDCKGSGVTTGTVKVTEDLAAEGGCHGQVEDRGFERKI